MPKYNGTVSMLIDNTIEIAAEIKRLKQSAKVAEKMSLLFEQQSAIMADQEDINQQQIALLKEQQKVITKLGKIK